MELTMKYFVLKPKAKHRSDVHATASQQAMRMYALVIRDHDEDLANELTEWVKAEERRQQTLPTKRFRRKDSSHGKT